MIGPIVKITVQSGSVTAVESDIPLRVQVIDADAKAVGDDWSREFISLPNKLEPLPNGRDALPDKPKDPL